MEEAYLSGEDDVVVDYDDSDVDDDAIADVTTVPSLSTSGSNTPATNTARASLASNALAKAQQAGDSSSGSRSRPDAYDDDIDEAFLASLDAEAEQERRTSDRMRLLEQLPYQVDTLDEMDTMLEHAYQRILQSVYMKDKEAGLLLWHERLIWLVQKRYPMKPSLHIKLIKLYYHLATLPSAPGSLAFTSEASRFCIFLLSSPKMKPEHFRLPWRPLYDRMYREQYASARQGTLLGVGASATMIAMFEELANSAQRFFAIEGPEGEQIVEDMMGVILAKMDGTNSTWTKTAFELATSFLPKRLAYKWFHPMWRLWKTFHSATATRKWYRVLGATSQLYSKDIIKDPLPVKDGERNVGFFTETHFKMIMSTTLQEISPASRNSDDSGLSLVDESKIALQHLARTIAGALADDGPDGSSIALDYFNRFLTAVEHKFHPLSGGVGQLQVSCLIHILLTNLVNRVAAEAKPSCQVPSHKRLTKRIIDELTERLNGLVLMTLFSKQVEAADLCQGSLLRIATIRPDLAIPPVIERSFQGLQALETSERTQPIMKCLSLLAVPMLRRSHHKEASQHLYTLLHLCLPGIDPNDPFKTINTGLLVAMLVHAIQVEDLTKVDHDSAATSSGTAMMLDGEAAPEAAASAGADDADIDAAVRAGTEGAEDWVVQFFRRTLQVFSSLAEEGAMPQSAWETEVQAATALIGAASFLCQSLSARLFDVALDVVANYAASNPATNCVKQMGQLVFAFARIDGDKTLARFLPICDQRIRYELSLGAGASLSTSNTSAPIGDTALDWFLSILGGAVSSAGSDLLKHRDQLLSLLAHAAEHCRAGRSVYLLSRVLVKMLIALTTVYPSEERFVNPEEWASSDFKQASFRSWGKTYKVDEVSISWHVPSDAEIGLALEVVDRFGNDLLNEVSGLLQAPVGQRGTTWSNSFCRKLTLARAVLTGIPALIELPAKYDGEDVSDMDSDVLDFYRAWSPISAWFALRDQDDERYKRVLAFRQKFATTVAEAGSRLQEVGGDEHLDDSRVVLRCISSALLHYGFTDELHSPTSYSDLYLLGALKLVEKQKDFPRIWWIRQAFRHYKVSQRLRAIRRRRMALDDALLRELIKFTQSEYRSIRIRAQNIVQAISTNFSGYRTMSMPLILDALQVSAPKHRIKGAIFLLFTDTYNGWLAFHAKFLPSVWQALIALQAHPDYKVQELAGEAAETIVTPCGPDSISFMGIDLRPYLSKASARAMQNAAGDGELLKRVQADIERRVAVQAQIYGQLRDSALTVLDDPKAHWTLHSAALWLLGLLDRVYEPVRADILEQLARYSTDPNPELRAKAMLLFARLLYYIKIRTLAPSKELLSEYMKKQPLSYTHHQESPVSPDAITRRLASFRENISTESELEETCLQDSWLLPEQRLVFFKLRTGPPLMYEEGSIAAVEALKPLMTSKEWWSSFVQRNAEDKNRTPVSTSIAALCKGVVELFGPPVVEALTAAIEQVVAEDASDRANHRAAAEAAVGLLRGIKTWKLEEQQAVQKWFGRFAAPLFKTLSSECSDVWRTSLINMLSNRDPRRNRFIIDFILEQLRGDADADEQSAWEQNKAHLMLSSLVYALGSKLGAWLPELTAAILPKMDASYFAVTHVVGATLAEVDLLHCAPRFTSVRALLDACEGDYGTLLDMKGLLTTRLTEMFARLDELLPSRTPPAQGTMSKADRLAFSILSWSSKMIEDHRNVAVQDVLLDFAPRFQAMYELKDNRELSGAALAMIVRCARFGHHGAAVDDSIEKLIKLQSSAESWNTRMNTLTVLHMASSRHAFVCSPETAERVLDLIVNALQDEHVDVRTEAARCLTEQVMRHHRGSIDRLIKLFVKQTTETVLPLKSDPRYGEALRKLHGALLGAGALVSAFPTSVPDWMGSLITQTLAMHDEDPAPIGPSVRKVATAFKETHEMYREGSWDEHAARFTEDELAVVHDWTLGRAADYIA